MKQAWLLIFISVTLHSFAFPRQKRFFQPSACARAVLLVGNIPTFYLAKSSLSSGHRSSCASSMKPPLTTTGPGRAPPSCVLPTSLSVTLFSSRWSHIAMPSFLLGGAHLHNKTIDCKSRVNPSLSFISPTMLVPRMGSMTSS